MHKASEWSSRKSSHADTHIVYLQNMVLRELLPRHGIVFLPLDVPWVEDDLTRRGGHRDTHGTAIDVDLERTAAVGEAFLTKIDYALRYLE